MHRVILFFALISSLICCNKEEEGLDFSISLVDTFPLIISEFQENIVVKIKYQHSEGYIGFSNPDVLSLEIKDSRLVNSDYFHLCISRSISLARLILLANSVLPDLSGWAFLIFSLCAVIISCRLQFLGNSNVL